MMSKTPVSTSEASLRLNLLCAYHVLDLDGQGSGLGGHVSARATGEEAFWCHAFGLAFDEVTQEDLIKLDFRLNKLAGSGKANPTLIFHARIYAARPDVQCIVHTHADHVTALTASGAPFEMVMQLAAILHEDTASLDEYDGIIEGRDGGDQMAQALGAKRLLLLKNHGLISVGRSVGEAVIGALVAEANAALHLRTLAVGIVDKVPVVMARYVEGSHVREWLGLEEEGADCPPLLERVRVAIGVVLRVAMIEERYQDAETILRAVTTRAKVINWPPLTW